MNSRRFRADLRPFLLGTLSKRRRVLLEAALVESEELRAALEREREALAMLDSLPDAVPDRDLTAATLGRLAATHERQRPVGWLPVVATCAALLLTVVSIRGFQHWQSQRLLAESAHGLKQMGLAMKMYAGENKGVYPPRAPYPGVWAPDLRVLYPDYVSDPSLLVNPRDPRARELGEVMKTALAQEPPDWETATRAFAQSYVYHGLALPDDEHVPGLSRRLSLMAKRGVYDGDVTEGGPPVLRARDGVERFFITDINNPAAGITTASRIPLIFEVVYSEDDPDRPEGCNVLFMDGHVEYIEYGAAFPVLPSVGEAFPPPPME